MRKLWRLAVSAAIAGIGLTSAYAENAPAGADKTKIKDWADPRPAAWSEPYPLFGPVTAAATPRDNSSSSRLRSRTAPRSW
jgi:hypothetical protein